MGTLYIRSPTPNYREGVSAKLCGIVQEMELWNFCSSSFSTDGVSRTLRRGIQGMELLNFRRWPHVHSAGRPSRWASDHISVTVSLTHVVTSRRNAQFKPNSITLASSELALNMFEASS